MKLFQCPRDSLEIKQLLGKMDLVTLLVHPLVDEQLLDEVCSCAKTYGFRSVCAQPIHIGRVVSRLKGSDVRTVYCIGESSGYGDPLASILAGMEEAFKEGASEAVIPMNLSKVLDGDMDGARDELREMLLLSKNYGAEFTLALDAHVLSDSEVLKVVALAVEAGVEHVKTSAGIAPDDGRATFHHMSLITDSYKDRIGIKAGGGTRYSFLEDSQALLDCGAETVDAGEMVISQLEEISYKEG